MSKTAKQNGWHSRLIAPDIWYISYRSKIRPKHDSEQSIMRGARRFKSETEAKKFAQEIITNGWSASAGTINPYKPKKVISSRQILAWIAESE